MIRALLIGAALLVGCERECKDGTLFVEVVFSAAARGADRLRVVVSVDGVERNGALALSGDVARGNVEVRFPGGYPRGAQATIHLVAEKGGVGVASGSTGPRLLSEACTRLTVELGATADLAVEDAAIDLASVEDLAGVEDFAVAADLTIAGDLAQPPDLVCMPFEAGTIQYVDPTAGTDDPEHGASAGTCAYKTLEYALMRATGTLRLATATYQYGNNPGDSFVMTGTQAIDCKAGSGRATLSWESALQHQRVVRMTGTANVLTGCNLVGGTQETVRVESIATGEHLISDCDISGGNTGVQVFGSNLRISLSQIHNNSAGVYWNGSPTGTMTDNVFYAHGSSWDILCASPAPNVVGTGNARGINDMGTRPALGCFTCQNCSFN